VTGTFCFADTHCHLYFDVFDADRDSVLEAACDVGLVRCLVPGIDLVTSRAAIDLAQKNPVVFAGVGFHPNNSMQWDNQSLHQLDQLAGKDKVVAVGEIGLDYYRKSAPAALQKMVFEAQLEIAQLQGLPVVLHCREAFSDLLIILTGWINHLRANHLPLADRPGVLHSFSGGLEEAKIAIDLGFYIGITGPITYKNAERLREVISAIPLNKMLLETDAPFLAPHPHRGKRNEPRFIPIIAGKIAELLGVTQEHIARITTDNARHLFRWSEEIE
jgi:TatD DNase family protein